MTKGLLRAGQNVTFVGTVDDEATIASALVVNGGTGGALDFQAAVGATTSLNGLTATGATISLGGASVETNGQAIAFNGAVSLGNQATITVDSTDGGVAPLAPWQLDAAADCWRGQGGGPP